MASELFSEGNKADLVDYVVTLLEQRRDGLAKESRDKSDLDFLFKANRLEGVVRVYVNEFAADPTDRHGQDWVHAHDLNDRITGVHSPRESCPSVLTPLVRNLLDTLGQPISEGIMEGFDRMLKYRSFEEQWNRAYDMFKDVKRPTK